MLACSHALSPISRPQHTGGDNGEVENGDNTLTEDDDEPLSIADSCCSDERESALPPKPRSRATSARSNARSQVPQPNRRVANVKVE